MSTAFYKKTNRSRNKNILSCKKSGMVIIAKIENKEKREIMYNNNKLEESKERKGYILIMI